LKVKVKSLSPQRAQRAQSYAERIKSEFGYFTSGLLKVVCIVCSVFSFPLRNSASSAVKVVDFDRIRDSKEGCSYGN